MVHRDVRKQFGLAIKTWRGRSGLSQEELAWRAGLHRTYVADIERGARNPSLQSIQKLAAALRLSFSTLFEPFGDTPLPAGNDQPGQQADILFVEDDADDVALTMAAFRRANVKNSIHVAHDGIEAMEYLFGEAGNRGLKNRPKLILLDLHLPRLDGMEVLRRIKADENARTIPVIILTSSQTSSQMLECRRLGAEFYIVKPVDFKRFCQVVPRLSGYWRLFLPGEHSYESRIS
ncbi:MAG TPA: response regulator [Verrucomicrobiae bacterium]|nr:response regulator [Verrucomicrobiae bacterium]